MHTGHSISRSLMVRSFHGESIPGLQHTGMVVTCTWMGIISSSHTVRFLLVDLHDAITFVRPMVSSPGEWHTTALFFGVIFKISGGANLSSSLGFWLPLVNVCLAFAGIRGIRLRLVARVDALAASTTGATERALRSAAPPRQRFVGPHAGPGFSRWAVGEALRAVLLHGTRPGPQPWMFDGGERT